MTSSTSRPSRLPTVGSIRPRTSTLIPEPVVKEQQTRVLLVDDEPNVRRSLARC